MTGKPRHLVSVADLTDDEMGWVLERAASLKTTRRSHARPLTGRALALIFEKPSLRTRLSFDVAMQDLGGTASYLSPAEVGLGRRESVADVARVVSRLVDAAVLRTNAHETIEEFARYSTIPVLNGLSDVEHPCQAVADLVTMREHKGDLRGVVAAFVGDGNNVAHSLMLAAAMTGLTLRVASPEGYEPGRAWRAEVDERAKRTSARITVGNDPVEAVRGADVVYTDVWTSMGQEAEYERRRRAFKGFQLNAALLAHAAPDAVVMHDLPAHRGEEITDDVLDGARSVVFDQAENRLHAQKALLCWALEGGS
ncbi:MAG TPA: ornithine carbamoyltransferase [Candidatus Limnocylindria bacterium]|nr:ornithine carbamoyltransferase [Candidatus Limnocylindria bacterium]